MCVVFVYYVRSHARLLEYIDFSSRLKYMFLSENFRTVVILPLEIVLIIVKSVKVAKGFDMIFVSFCVQNG